MLTLKYKYLIPITAQLLFNICSGDLRADDESGGGGGDVARITYLAVEGIYINAGSEVGLAVNDTITITRNGKKLGLAVVSNISTKSAACNLISGGNLIRVKDNVSFGGKPISLGTKTEVETTLTTPSKKNNRKPKQKQRTNNRLKGNISFQNYYQQDMTGAKLSSYQPSVRTSIRIEDLFDQGITFRFRHRTRLYHRSREYTSWGNANEFNHKVYEMAITSGNGPDSPHWGAGRIRASYVRGLGQLDGLYFVKPLNTYYKVGIVAGVVPDAYNTEIRINRRKVGLFVSWDKGEYESGHISMTAALSTSYEKDIVDREFFYWQGSYVRGTMIRLYQSMELDINRSWRFDAGGKRLSITNLFSTVNFSPIRQVGIYFSYDERKNIRYFEYRNLQDEIFDDAVHRGFKVGIQIRPSNRISFNGNYGLRRRDGGISHNNKFVTGNLRISRFPFPSQSVMLRMSYMETMFSSIYAPAVTMRFRLRRSITTAFTGAARIYKTGSTETKSYYIDSSLNYSSRTRYYFSAGYRQYFDEYLQSAQIFMELGVNL